MDFLEKYYDPAINFWKAAVTFIHPAFHVRNAYSNLYLMWITHALGAYHNRIGRFHAPRT